MLVEQTDGCGFSHVLIERGCVLRVETSIKKSEMCVRHEDTDEMAKEASVQYKQKYHSLNNQ